MTRRELIEEGVRTEGKEGRKAEWEGEEDGEEAEEKGEEEREKERKRKKGERKQRQGSRRRRSTRGVGNEEETKRDSVEKD